MSELEKVLEAEGIKQKEPEVKDLAPPVEQKEIINSNPTPEQVAEKPKKTRKPRKPMSDEHKKKCRESLAKAREASKAKRQKNAYIKRLKKKEEEKEKDDQIKQQILNDDKDKEIAELKKKLNSLTLQDVVKKPEPKPLPTIEEVEESKQETEPPKNMKMEIEKVQPPEEPVVISEPVNDIKQNHNIYKEKTRLDQKRKFKRRKGMARYGRR